MINNIYYDMIFKRKSFHTFTGLHKKDKITEEEINQIYDIFNSSAELVPNIKIEMKIVSEKETNSKRGAEYYILFYSEKKDNYLQNIGYIGEQLDLYLASGNIGALWLGMNKPLQNQHNGLDFVIMMAISKATPEKFRKDMFKSSRKSIDDIFVGEQYKEIFEIARFSPSACNSQPWEINSQNKAIEIYRKKGKRGIMPLDKINYFNKIDIGIFLLITEVCLYHNNIKFIRNVFVDDDSDKCLIAQYQMQ